MYRWITHYRLANMQEVNLELKYCKLHNSLQVSTSLLQIVAQPELQGCHLLLGSLSFSQLGFKARAAGTSV